MQAELDAIRARSLQHPQYRNWRMFKGGLCCLAVAFILWKFNLGTSYDLFDWALGAGLFLVLAGLFPMLVAWGFWIVAAGAVLSPALASGGGLSSVSWGYWVFAAVLILLGVAVAKSSKLE